MRKIPFTRYIAFVLIVALLISIASVFGGLSVTYAQDSTGSYYSSITAVGGKALLGQLHDLITSTHEKYTSYSDCKNPSTILKTDPGTNGNVMEFYSQANISSKWGGGNQGTWNREHVWCQSLSNGMWGQSGGGSDLHHIRPVESGLNSARGNNKYGIVSSHNTKTEVYYEDSSNKNVALGGYNANGTFEPLDNVKGDVARIVMYVYTHYNTYSNVGGTTNGNGSATFGTLNFRNVVSASSESAAIALLLEWNELDPVDDIERTRNDAVYAIQGNRNPFIDNPNYANLIWSESAVIPEVEDITVTPDDITLNVGQSRQLSVSVSPLGADSRVKWESDDETVATVSASGLVTARGEGDAFITVTSVADPSIDALVLVTVNKSDSPVVDGDVRYLTIDVSSFDMTQNYSFKNWTSSGITGYAFIYGGNSQYANDGNLQFNVKQSSYYLANSKALPGAIKSVTVKTSKGEDRPWKLLTSTVPYEQVAGAPKTGNDQGTKTVTLDGVTWNVSGNDTCFALVYALDATSGVCYIDSVIVEYVVGTSEVPDPTPEPSVTGIEVTPSSITMEESEASMTKLKSGITVNAVYDNGDKKAVTDYQVSGFNPANFTAQTVEISWGGFKKTITVTVNQHIVIPPEAKAVAIEVDPTDLIIDEDNASLEYIMSHIVVKVLYDNGDKKAVSDYQISGFNTTIYTAQNVTISRGDFTASLSVTINKQSGSGDTLRVDAFIASVRGIANALTPYSRHEAISNAIVEYNELTESEKEKSEVKVSLQTLNEAIADYNNLVADVNEEANKASEATANACATFISLAGVLLFIIKHLL